MTAAAILEGLSKSKLAVELNDDERRVLAQAMSLRDLKQGEVLIQEGVYTFESINEAVAEPVVVDPDDRLRSHALAAGWQLLELAR